jgi:formylglycine-generating enzyme
MTGYKMKDMVFIPGGTFTMGSENFYPEERPSRKVSVDGFWIDKFEVTNAEYVRFVSETGYVTLSERTLDPSIFPNLAPDDLAPGSMLFRKAAGPVNLNDFTNWWFWVLGTDWKHPYGPQSSLDGLSQHPVVHVAYEDVETYAHWAGKELPTEAEWEYAARGGLEGKNFTWGDEDPSLTNPLANTWQGEFPWQNLLVDKYERTAPVGSFAPNGYGLYDMAGNVWEWTTDWFVSNPGAEVKRPCCSPPLNPRVVTPEKSYDPMQPAIKIPRKVLKGGSHLCAPNYCLRYRPAARSPQMIDTSMCHLGFRCIVREEKNEKSKA